MKNDLLVQKCNQSTINIVSAPVAATCDALANKLGSVRESVVFYYNRSRGQIPTTLHHEVESEAEEYFDVKNIEDEYSEVEDIQNIFDDNDWQLLEDSHVSKP